MMVLLSVVAGACSAIDGEETSSTLRRFCNPPVPNANWLRVGGDVEQPLVCGLATAQNFQSRLIVTRSPQGAPANANSTVWEGVHISEIVRRVRPRSGVAAVILTGADGTHTRIRLEELLAPRAVLAFRRDGRLSVEREGYLFCCVLEEPEREPIRSVVRLDFAR